MYRKTITHNGSWLCVQFFALSECSILAQCSKAKTDAKPLLGTVKFYGHNVKNLNYTNGSIIMRSF